MSATARHGEGGPSGPLSRVNHVAVPEAALLWAQLGISVFPCNGKAPLTARGFKDATTDEAVIKAWFEKFPNANVAAATGAVSGIVVLDADVRDDIDGVGNATEAVPEALGTFQVETGGGGRHFFFTHPGEDRRVSNSPSGLPAGVDVRGDGGYVILPPSIHPQTREPYLVANPNGKWLAWQRKSSDARGHRERADLSGIELPEVDREDPKAVLLREGACTKIRGARQGERNAALNSEAFQIAPEVSSGRLALEKTWAELSDAARASGMSEKDDGISGTLRSGLLSGIAANPPTDIAEMLDFIEATYRRFIRTESDHAYVALALHAAHTYAFDAARYTPYPLFSSPEPESGKTRGLEVAALVVHRPWMVTEPTAATLYRRVEKRCPTLLLDEYDSIFNKRENLDIRAVLNAGFKRDSYVPRCVGPNQEVVDFAVFCPKMMAGLGRTSDSVESRAIPIRMQRRLPDEHVDDFDEEVEAEATEWVRSGLQRWADANVEALKRKRPVAPKALSDRQRDVWRPLLSIADLAGGEWPAKARAAAVALHKRARADASEGTLLLAHIRDAFGLADKLATKAMIEALVDREDGPWAVWWARAVNDENFQGPASRLAKMLRPYGVLGKVIRIDDRTHRGYDRADFEHAWKRYLPEVSP